MATYNPKLHYMSALTALATFGLIVAGGLVTSHDAGLSVPDWPLSFGQVMPEMVGGVFYEHGHRMVATTVGFLTIILCLWLWKAERRAWVRKLGWAALAAVIIQGVLGGITVLFRLPVAVSVLHACLAQAFFCLTVAITLFTSRGWIEGTSASSLPRNASNLSIAVTGAIYFQLVLGALLRHSGTVDGTKAVRLIMPVLAAHILGALVVTVLLTLLVVRLLWCEGEHSQRMGYVLMSILVLQLILGVGAYLARIDALGSVGALPRVAVATSHVAVGALLLASCLWSSLLLVRPGGWGGRVDAPRFAGEVR